MPTASNYYDILQVSVHASAPVIKAAYRCLVQLNHPDKHDGNHMAAQRLVQINQAYAILSNPARRSRYDAVIGLPAPVNERRGSGATAPQSNVSRVFAFRPLD